ncbi:MAG: transcriptional regulator [Christensenellales bacterium]
MLGMTQKYFGQLPEFPKKTAEVHVAKYETGARTTEADLAESLAGVLGGSPLALSVLDIDSYLGLIHTLFTLEDRYGLKIDEADGEVCLKVDVRKNKDAAQLHEMLCAWRQAAAMLKAGEITQDEYDRWRYRYPESDTIQR